MNYLDLFHGIGGFALGAYWAGMKFENHYCSDIEKYCKELYKLRFPDSIQLGDISKIDFEELPKGDWIITGGFPCQDISIAGKGAGIEGKRSGLWSEYWRAIRVLRPKYAIIENVGAITFRGLDTVLGSLAEIGYDAEWQDIRAEDVGAPHKRERIWIVAYPCSVECKTGPKKQRVVRKMQNNRSKHDNINRPGETRNREISDTDKIGLQKERPKQQTAGIARKITSKGWWTTEPAVGRLAHGISGRVDRLKGLGNSIIPQIAELLFKLIKNVFSEDK